MAKIKRGKGQASPDTPGHTPGIQQGNQTGSYESMPGHLPDGRSTAERSTGVDAKARNPVDSSSPNLSPP